MASLPPRAYILWSEAVFGGSPQQREDIQSVGRSKPCSAEQRQALLPPPRWLQHRPPARVRVYPGLNSGELSSPRPRSAHLPGAGPWQRVLEIHSHKYSPEFVCKLRNSYISLWAKLFSPRFLSGFQSWEPAGSTQVRNKGRWLPQAPFSCGVPGSLSPPDAPRY